MNTTQDDGGPAYPWSYMDRDSTGQEVTREQGQGMSLRDWFAGMALQGWLATYGENTSHPGLDEANGEAYMKSLAQCSYKLADAMISARKEAK